MIDHTATIMRLKQEIEDLTLQHEKTLDDNNRAHFERQISVKKLLIAAYEESTSK